MIARNFAARLALAALLIGASTARADDWSPDAQTVIDEIKTAARKSATGIKVKGEDANANSVRFSPDGKRILTASCARKAAFEWDAASGQKLRAFPHGDCAHTALYSPDGTKVLTLGFDGAVLWDASGNPLGRFEHGVPNFAAFSPDGGKLLLVDTVLGARAWDLSTGKPIGEIRSQGRTQLAYFEPSQKKATLVHSQGLTQTTGATTRSFASFAQLLNEAFGTRFGEKTRRIAPGMPQSVAATPDGSKIFVNSFPQGTGLIWDTRSKSSINLAGPAVLGGMVVAAAFSPDGSKLVTSSFSNEAVIWNAATGQRIGTLTGHAGKINSIGITADGHKVVTVSDDKTMRVWTDTAIGAWSPDLTQGEIDAIEKRFAKRLEEKAAIVQPAEKKAETAEERFKLLWDAPLDGGK